MLTIHLIVLENKKNYVVRKYMLKITIVIIYLNR